MTKLRGRRSTGQSMVEFALILPVLILILIGLFDAGRAIYAYNTVSNSARAGARVAIVDQNTARIKDAAKQKAAGLGLTDSDVTTTVCTTLACPVTVKVAYAFTPVTPIVGDLFHPTISSTASMPMERKYVSP
jgi:Flp pilus assembly protein TadG